MLKVGDRVKCVKVHQKLDWSLNRVGTIHRIENGIIGVLFDLSPGERYGEGHNGIAHNGPAATGSFNYWNFPQFVETKKNLFLELAEKQFEFEF